MTPMLKGLVVMYLSLLLSSLENRSVRGQEEQRQAVCSNEEISLRCQSETFLAIHEAIFTTEFLPETVSCVQKDLNQSSCTEDLRLSVNDKCSGNKTCSYNYENYDMRTCIGTGAVIVKFVCVQKSQLQSFCNVGVREQTGYISSPGFPYFYPQLDRCTWNITGGEGQKVVAQVLDISTIPPQQHYSQAVCDNNLSLMDTDDRKLITTCGGDTLDFLKQVESHGNILRVNFHTAHFNPFRGFLLRYQLKNCPTIPPPKLGYLHHRNESLAVYVCYRGHVFNDSLVNSQTILCIDGIHWNTTLSTCIPIEDQKEEDRSKLQLISNNLTMTNDQPVIIDSVSDDPPTDLVPEYDQSSLIVDIWVPSILMIALLVGNIIIVVIILKLRRKNKAAEKYEFEPSPLVDPAPSEV
ncbi:uncharacterized protein LOC143229946 isoform X2 [Tachypleus tridentatus]|uniref:uncharacterized protein LOC143229946 isoform X2 n=1 Tax=Tachypleus tridentatus TaxID=6853 RepID=UPI003FD61DEA